MADLQHYIIQEISKISIWLGTTSFTYVLESDIDTIRNNHQVQII